MSDNASGYKLLWWHLPINPGKTARVGLDMLKATGYWIVAVVLLTTILHHLA